MRMSDWSSDVCSSDLERREAGGLALHELLFGEGVVAAGDQRLQQRVLRVVRLQQHLAWLVGAPGASGYLDQQLGELLPGAEVGREQALRDSHHDKPRRCLQLVSLHHSLGASFTTHTPSHCHLLYLLLPL